MIRLSIAFCCLFFLKSLYQKLWGVRVITLVGFFLLKVDFSYNLENIFIWTSFSSLCFLLTLFLTLLIKLIRGPLLNEVRYRRVIILLCFSLILSFTVNRFFLFYFFFEFSLIPTIILILGWGYQPERTQAGLYLILYTVAASLPLLIILIRFYQIYFSSNIWLINLLIIKELSPFSFFLLSIAFLVKLPVYRVHIWLPKAHVEAPLAGSIILAGVLLKLGGYGIAHMYLLTQINIQNLLYYIIRLRLCGGVLTRFYCIRQTDIKLLIAYSSIGHIASILAGFILILPLSFKAALLILVAHGLRSSALFGLAAVTYSSTGRRRIIINKGLLSITPLLAIIWFTFIIINIGFPPSLNFWSEAFIFPTAGRILPFLLFPLGIIVFIRAVYNSYLYSSINHGISSLFFAKKFQNSFIWLGLFLHFCGIGFIGNLVFF